MSKVRRLALSVAEVETPPGIPPVIGLMDTVMKRWTEKQTLAVVGILQGLQQSKIAGLDATRETAGGCPALASGRVGGHRSRPGLRGKYPWRAMSPNIAE